MAKESQPETRSEKGKIITIGVIVIIGAILVYTYLTVGSQGFSIIVKRVITYSIIVFILGLIVWVVLRILRKPKIDLVENDRQDIIDAAIQSKPPMVKDLYFTGDKDHGEFRVGKIIGYCQLHSYKDLDLIAGLTSVQLRDLESQGKLPSDYIIKEDCFVFKRLPFPLSIFEQPKVLRTLEDEHSQLIGDVKIYGVSMIRKFGMYWPNRAHLDIARIDIGVIREAWRGQVHQFLKDAVSIQQRAIGLDSGYKKSLDQRKLLKIPSPMGEEESRRSE
jgi:hypothetical protein